MNCQNVALQTLVLVLGAVLVHNMITFGLVNSIDLKTYIQNIS